MAKVASDIKQQKAVLRQEALQRRRQIVAGCDPVQAGAQALARIFSAQSQRFRENIRLHGFGSKAGTWTIALYIPINGEIDPRAIISMVTHAVRWALPVVVGAGQALIFREYSGDDTQLVPGTFRIPVPPPHARSCRPDIVLVPLLAFTSACYRLGYGGGFYDRTLAQSALDKPVSIGLAYDAQLLADIPLHPTDMALDMVATPTRIYARAH